VIDETVWAATGAGTSVATKEAAPTTANMTKAARKPPHTRIPNFMRHAPLSFHAGPTPRRADRFPFIVPLVANFTGVANVGGRAIPFSFQDVADRQRHKKAAVHEAARCRMSL
jgi:hypothetical protein